MAYSNNPITCSEPNPETRKAWPWREETTYISMADPGVELNPAFEPAGQEVREAWQDRLANANDSAVQKPNKRGELLNLHQRLTNKAYQIMVLKNENYATETDPFRNFRMFGLLGILVRMSDKLSRLRVFEENGVDNISDESIEDTLMDLINYCVLFGALRSEAK